GNVRAFVRSSDLRAEETHQLLTLSLHDALPISPRLLRGQPEPGGCAGDRVLLRQPGALPRRRRLGLRLRRRADPPRRRAQPAGGGAAGRLLRRLAGAGPREAGAGPAHAGVAAGGPRTVGRDVGNRDQRTGTVMIRCPKSFYEEADSGYYDHI